MSANIEEIDKTINSIKQQIDYTRHTCVSHIFEVVDGIPNLLESFSKEGLSEDDSVHKLGEIFENVLVEYEKLQLPLMFDYIKYNKHKKEIEKQSNRIIIP